MNDPWVFGWTQLLTIIGMVITTTIAIAGFRTFGRWQREQIEGRKIELALGALSLAHESKAVFGHIRTRVMYKGEGADVPNKPGESPEHKQQRESFFAVLKRIEASNDYFTRVGNCSRNSSPCSARTPKKSSTNSIKRAAT
jgi:hypothetical protein